MPSPPKELAKLIIKAVGDGLAPYASVLTSVINASRITEQIRRKPGFGQLTKADSSPVTIADLASQMAVVNGIRETFPDDLIIAEEDSGSLQETRIRSEISEVLSGFDVSVLLSFIHLSSTEFYSLTSLKILERSEKKLAHSGLLTQLTEQRDSSVMGNMLSV